MLKTLPFWSSGNQKNTLPLSEIHSLMQQGLGTRHSFWTLQTNTSTINHSLYINVLQAFQEARSGVSEAFQVSEVPWNLSPLMATAEAMDSSSAISSGVSVSDKAPMFWSRFPILVVPGMGHTSSPWWWTQARASCDVVHPFLVAISLTRSKRMLLCSIFSGWNRGRVCNAKHELQEQNLKPNMKEDVITQQRVSDYSPTH